VHPAIGGRLFASLRKVSGTTPFLGEEIYYHAWCTLLKLREGQGWDLSTKQILSWAYLAFPQSVSRWEKTSIRERKGEEGRGRERKHSRMQRKHGYCGFVYSPSKWTPGDGKGRSIHDHWVICADPDRDWIYDPNVSHWSLGTYCLGEFLISDR